MLRRADPASSSPCPPHASPTPQAADLISRIAPVMKKCDEEKLLAHLGVVLYENLGEEYPGACGLGVLSCVVARRAVRTCVCVCVSVCGWEQRRRRWGPSAAAARLSGAAQC